MFKNLNKIIITLEQKINNGEHALHFAATYGRPWEIELLISAGEDVNVTNNYGVTPLTAAVVWNKEHCIIELLNSGANPNTEFSLSWCCSNAGSEKVTLADYCILRQKAAEIFILGMYGMEHEQIKDHNNYYHEVLSNAACLKSLLDQKMVLAKSYEEAGITQHYQLALAYEEAADIWFNASSVRFIKTAYRNHYLHKAIDLYEKAIIHLFNTPNHLIDHNRCQKLFLRMSDVYRMVECHEKFCEYVNLSRNYTPSLFRRSNAVLSSENNQDKEDAKLAFKKRQ